MLAEMLETFVVCCKDIAKNGLVVTHHNCVTGKNHHVDIRDKPVTKAVLLVNELGLTPKGRFPFKPKPDPEFEKFMRGPNLNSGSKEPVNLDEILKASKKYLETSFTALAFNPWLKGRCFILANQANNP
jgi:hypothetical protein